MHAALGMWGSSSRSQLQHGLVTVRPLVNVDARGGAAGWPCACVAAPGSDLRRSPHRELELAMVAGRTTQITIEASLAERWCREYATPSEIAKRLGRSTSTTVQVGPAGRPVRVGRTRVPQLESQRYCMPHAHCDVPKLFDPPCSGQGGSKSWAHCPVGCMGQPPALTEAQADQLVVSHDKMGDEGGGNSARTVPATVPTTVPAVKRHALSWFHA